MDVAKASDQIDALIEKRAAGGGKANAVEELWKASARRHHEKLTRQRRAEWYAYHLDQAERLRRTMTVLVEAHEKAATLLEEGEA